MNKLTMLFSFFLLGTSACKNRHGEEAVAEAKTKAQIGMLCKRIDDFMADNKSTLNRDVGLNVLVSGSDIKVAERQRKLLIDGWKNSVVPIYAEGSIIGVKSFGPNGIDDNGVGDDLVCVASSFNK